MRDHKLKLEDSRRDVILILGRTGVGKTTLTEILFGDLAALESTFDEELLCVKIKNNKTEPCLEQHSMFISDTISPKLYTDPTKPEVAIYDCPGFCDTRGTSNEIATGVYLSEIVQHANRVKIVVAVDYDTVKPKADRSKFTDTILPEVLDFVLDNDMYQGGVFLLVTKYANPTEDPTEKFISEDIVDSIAEFLREAQEYAAGKMKDRKSAINALFKKSWLQRTKDGRYSNIGFSRTITRGGKLSDMDSVTRRTYVHTQLVENPNFNFRTSNPKHFGCPISARAKLEIRKVLRNLENGVEELLRSVGQKVVTTFVQSAKDKEKLSSFFDHYVTFLNDLNGLTEEESGLSLRGLEVLGKFDNNIQAGATEELDKLEEMVERMKYLSSVDIEESSQTWRDAHGKWNEAILRMAKDLVTEFRKAQRVLALEVHQLLESASQHVIEKFLTATPNELEMSTLFDDFHAFTADLEVVTSEEPGLSYKSLEVLRHFGRIIQVNINSELDKLSGILRSLKYLTEVDAEQCSETWSDVHLKWNHVMELMKKDIAQLEAQIEFSEAKVQGELAVARAEKDLEAARAHGELAQAKAEAELAEAKAVAERAEAEAENRLLLAKAQKDMAAVRAQAEVAEANHRAELAEAAMADAMANNKSGSGPLGRLVDRIMHIASFVIKPLSNILTGGASNKNKSKQETRNPNF